MFTDERLTSSLRPLVGKPRRFSSALSSTTVFSLHPAARELPTELAAELAAADTGVEWMCAICPCAGGPGERALRVGADRECLNVLVNIGED